MADGFTANYSFTLVQVGASRDTWGTKLNANFTAIDTTIKAVSDAVALKLAASSYTAADVLAKLLTVDGAASGLDADTVDGIQAAAFMLNSGFTGAAILALLLGVDGSGSLLDADKLDGNDSSAFALAGHTHSYMPLAGGAFTADITKQSEGVYPHFADSGITKGRMYIATAAGSDPTSQPGDMWLGY